MLKSEERIDDDVEDEIQEWRYKLSYRVKLGQQDKDDSYYIDETIAETELR